MANIRIDLKEELTNGHEATFQAPCNCTAITGIVAYYPSNGDLVSKSFTFRDAHGNDLTGIGNLFAQGAFVKVILDSVNGHAYIQNAGTNGYLEHRMKYRTATLAVNGWTTSAPYTQTVTVSGITANDAPMISMGTPATPNAANYKSTKKAYGMIDRAVTGSGTITFYCYSKKPTVAIPIVVKGA